MYRVASLWTLIFLFFAGCHTHPLHEDVTELSTSELVRKIQCEAADFIRDVHPAKNAPLRLEQLEKANAIIRKKTEEVNKLGEDVPPSMDLQELREMQANIKLQAQQLLQALREKPSEHKLQTIFLELQQLNLQQANVTTIEKAINARDAAAAKLREMVKGRTDLFGDIITFEANDALFAFVFTITEANDLSAGASIVWPITLGTFTLNGSLTDKRSRLGERKVSLVLTFGELNTLPCGQDYHANRHRAHRYPITGTIGLSEVFTQYLDVVKSGSRYGKFDTGGKSFSDRIVFTTEFGGTLKPSIAKKVGPRTVNANLDLAASRKDVHELTMFIRPVDSGSRALVVPVQEVVIRRMPTPRIVRLPP